MANKTIDELDAAAALDGTEEIPIWQGSGTVKTTTGKFPQWADGGANEVPISDGAGGGTWGATPTDHDVLGLQGGNSETLPFGVNFNLNTAITSIGGGSFSQDGGTALSWDQDTTTITVLKTGIYQLWAKLDIVPQAVGAVLVNVRSGSDALFFDDFLFPIQANDSPSSAYCVATLGLAPLTAGQTFFFRAQITATAGSADGVLQLVQLQARMICPFVPFVAP